MGGPGVHSWDPGVAVTVAVKCICVASEPLDIRGLIEIRIGGGRGIRTPGSVAASAVFKISPNHFVRDGVDRCELLLKCVECGGGAAVVQGGAPSCCIGALYRGRTW